MKIGELAKSTGFSVQAIRYYEKEGLLSAPTRNEGNYRIYGQAGLEELTFIKHCRNLDIALSEIKLLMELRQLPDNQCIEINDLIDNQLSRIRCRISELKKLKHSLVSLRAKCGNPNTIKDCGILQNLQS